MAGPYLAQKYRTYASWGQDAVLPGNETGRRKPSPTEVAVKSRFLVYRHRVKRETDFLVGKREDLPRRVDGGWKIARRKIVLDQSVLLAKNLTVFF